MSNNVLVVGASGVFGSLLTKQFKAAGFSVLGTASSNESAARIPSEASLKLLLDLEKDSSIDLLSSYLRSQAMELHGVAIASGLVAFGDSIPSNDTNRLFAVNTMGPIKLISELEPILRPDDGMALPGFILGITGVVAEKPMAGLATYSASKASLSAYLKAIARPMAKRGVAVVDARPGHTETGLAGRAIYGTAPNFGTGMSADHVVERIINGIANRELELPASAF